MKNKFLLLLLGFTFCCKLSLFARTTSDKGTDFWVAYAGHIDGLTSGMTLLLSFEYNTNYQITSVRKAIATSNIVTNVTLPVFTGNNEDHVYIEASNLIEINQGVNLTSVMPISICSVISNSAALGFILILPTNTNLEARIDVFSQHNVGSYKLPLRNIFVC